MADCVTRRDVTPGRIRSAATAATVLSTSRRNASIVTSRSASGVSSSLQCDRPLVELANIITAGMTRPISTASCSGPDGSRGACPVASCTASAHRSTRRGSNRQGSMRHTCRHSTRDAVGRRPRARRGLVRVGEGLPQRLGLERPLIERDLAHARHRGDDRRLHRDSAHGAHHPGGGRRVAPGNLATGERRLGGGEERVAAHRDRRRPRVRGLADEPQHVALDTVGADHRTGRIAPSPRAPALARCGARGRRAGGVGRATDAPRACGPDRRRSRPARPRSRTPWRSTRLRTLSGTRLPLAPDDPSRLREKRAPSSSAKSTTAKRDRRGGALAATQRLDTREDAERAVEPTAVGHGVEVAADDDGVRPRARQA